MIQNGNPPDVTDKVGVGWGEEPTLWNESPYEGINKPKRVLKMWQNWDICESNQSDQSETLRNIAKM